MKNHGVANILLKTNIQHVASPCFISPANLINRLYLPSNNYFNEKRVLHNAPEEKKSILILIFGCKRKETHLSFFTALTTK